MKIAEPNIPAELSIICGLAIRYEDPEFSTNHLHIEWQQLMSVA